MPAMEDDDMTRLRLGYQAFVRAGNQDTAAIKEAEDSEGEEDGREQGESARLFYEETIKNDKYTKKRTLIGKGKCETVELSDSSEEEIEIIDCKANKDLLTAIQNNNLQMVKNIKNCDYNCRDEHGWTPLEIAAVLGHEDIVRFLLKKNASMQENQQILELLEKKGLTRILSLLHGTESREKPVDVIHLDLEEAVVVKCPDCETEYEENQRLKHLASIQHQMATTSIERHNPGFGIPEGNLGFRMLQREGWDGRSGLGPGSRGRLFPVKTSLRKHRVGLAEGDSVGARVTHRYESIQAVQKNNIVKKKHPVAKNLKKRRRDWRMEEVSKDQRLREEIGFI